MIERKLNKTLVTLAMVLAASLVGFVTGYTIPLISLRLSSVGTDTVLLGIIASLPAVGMMISSFTASYLSKKFVSKSILSTSLVVLTVATIISIQSVDFLYLILLRFLVGIACGIIVILGESWITGGASNKHTATLTGIYTSAFTGCQLLGPLLLSFGDKYQYYASFLIVSVAALSIFLVQVYSNKIRSDNPEQASWQGMYVFLPILASGVFCFAFFDASMLALFPIYAMNFGLAEKSAVLLLSIVLLGDAIMQIPIGLLADRYGVKKIHILCGLLFCATSASLPFMFKNPYLTNVICIAVGASAGGLYTLSLVRAGKLFSNHRLIAMNAILSIFWSAGSVSGPMISGTLIGVVGYYGLPALFICLGVTFIALQNWKLSPYASRN